jgi:hypothetical protein
MTLKEAFAKIDLRLNKVASGDYDNIWPYAKAEAINKAISDLIRRIKQGKNDLQLGDEESDVRVDDLQVLLKPAKLSFRDKGIYVQTETLPTDYLYFKRLTPFVSNEGSCSGVMIQSHLREEGSVDTLLQASFPSFQFEETFHTIAGNRANIYHNKEFHVERLELVYYRKPKKYDYKRLDTVLEFKDDVCELIVDEACKILASDLESINQKNLSQERTERNI